MAIPASGPISMSMLATEFSSSQTSDYSLGGLGTKLSSAVTYGQPVSMSVFYGQSLVTLTAFGMQDPTEPAGNASSACEGGSSNTAYHTGTGTYPAVGDTVYSDSSGTTLLVDGFYRINSGQAMNLENSEVQSLTNCGR